MMSYKPIILAVACTAFASCSKGPAGNPDGTLRLEIRAEMASFSDLSKSSEASVVRVGWEQSDPVFVYDGDVLLGTLYTPATIDDDRVAELSGTIAAPLAGHTTLTFIHSNILSTAPIASDGRISIDMGQQNDVLPFVVYGKADIATTSVAGALIPFNFATGVVKVAMEGLDPGEGIISSRLVGVNTRCELLLGEDGNVSVSGTTPGNIVSTRSDLTANSEGATYFVFGIPPSASGNDRLICCEQNRLITTSRQILSSGCTAGRCINTITEAENTAVNLGLSVNWASCNVGASAPEAAGRYFPYGDIEGQTWDSSAWSGGGFSSYTFTSNYYDSNYILKPEFDPSRAAEGALWRVPTQEEIQELISNCTFTWTTVGEVPGALFTSKIAGYTDRSIFFPACGYGVNDTLSDAGTGGYYRSSTFSSSKGQPYILHFSNDHPEYTNLASNRKYGCNVRSVFPGTI